MSNKAILKLERFWLANASFAIGFLFFLSIRQLISSEITFDLFNWTAWPEKIRDFMSVLVIWWASSAIFFSLFRFSTLLNWLIFNRLTQWMFIIANIALLGELVYLGILGRDGYFTRWYFQGPLQIAATIGFTSLLACTAWYWLIKKNHYIRSWLIILLAPM